MIVAFIVAEPAETPTTTPPSAVAIPSAELLNVHSLIGAKKAAEPSFLIA